MNNAGQSVTGMGLLAILAVLILLIVAIRMYAKLRRAQGEHDAKVEEAAPVAAAQQAEEAAPVVEEGIAPEIVAAIAAAIAALGAGHKPLIVRSIRRADGWSKSARAEQIYRF